MAAVMAMAIGAGIAALIVWCVEMYGRSAKACRSDFDCGARADDWP